MAEMHEVAEPTAVAFVRLVLPTACLSEVRHRRQFSEKRPAVVPSIVECIHCALGFFLPLVPRIHVADEVFSYIVTYMHLDQLPVFGQFAEEVFVKVVKLVLQVVICELLFYIEVAWVLIHVAD